MLRDPIIDEVRRFREHEAARQGFDVKAILAAAKRRQRRSRHKVERLITGIGAVPGEHKCCQGSVPPRLNS